MAIISQNFDNLSNSEPTLNQLSKELSVIGNVKTRLYRTSNIVNDNFVESDTRAIHFVKIRSMLDPEPLPLREGIKRGD